VTDHPRFSLVLRDKTGEHVVARGDTYAVIARRAAKWLADWRAARLTRGRHHCRAWAVGTYTWRLVGPPPDYSPGWLEITDAKGRLP